VEDTVAILREDRADYLKVAAVAIVIFVLLMSLLHYALHIV
jgi:hypothetical protein